MADDGNEPKPASSSGLVPKFLARSIVSPGVGVGVLAVAALATVPLWAHFHAPDVAGMASHQFANMQSNTAAADDGKPEAADPSPTPFPKHAAAPGAALASVFHRPSPAPTPPAFTGTQNVALAQSVAVTQPAQALPPTAQPLPPADTHTVFGDPSDTEVDVSKASGAPAPGRSNAPQVVAQSGGVGYVEPMSKYQIQEGTVIHCRLLTHVDSEQPGHVSGQVVEPVYSSADPQTEVIPAGANVQGAYSTASSGETRLLIIWHRINFPDGRAFEMSSQPGTDEMGTTGVGGSVNSHAGKIFGTALLYTALNAAGQSLSRSITLQGSSITQGFSGQQQTIKPTIYLAPPLRFDIVAVRDLALDRYEVRP